MKRNAYGFRDDRYFTLRLYALHDCRITQMSDEPVFVYSCIDDFRLTYTYYLEYHTMIIKPITLTGR